MINVPILRIALVQRTIAFEEKAYGAHPPGYLILAMLYTHMRCLQVMYVIAHVCVADLG